jgi:hypothetical protein
MAVPYVAGTFAGQTNGVINGLDYTIDLAALDLTLGQIVTQLAILNGNFTGLNTLLGSSIAVTANTVPGSISASLGNQANELQQIVTILQQIRNNGVALSSSVGKVADSVGQQSVTHDNLHGTLSLAVASMIKKNDYEIREGDAALKRADIDPQPKPAMVDTVKSAASDALEIHISEAVVNVTEQVSTNIISRLENYLQQTWLVQWAEGALKQLAINLHLAKLLGIHTDPVITVVDQGALKAGSSSAAGVCVPGVAVDTVVEQQTALKING